MLKGEGKRIERIVCVCVCVCVCVWKLILMSLKINLTRRLQGCFEAVWSRCPCADDQTERADRYVFCEWECVLLWFKSFNLFVQTHVHPLAENYRCRVLLAIFALKSLDFLILDKPESFLDIQVLSKEREGKKKKKKKKNEREFLRNFFSNTHH